MPDSTFASIGLSADIVDVLTAQGIESPFQIQTRTIPAALAEVRPRSESSIATHARGSHRLLSMARR